MPLLLLYTTTTITTTLWFCLAGVFFEDYSAFGWVSQRSPKGKLCGQLKQDLAGRMPFLSSTNSVKAMNG